MEGLAGGIALVLSLLVLFLICQGSLFSLWTLVRLPQSPLVRAPSRGQDLLALVAIQTFVAYCLVFVASLAYGVEPLAATMAESAAATSVEGAAAPVKAKEPPVTLAGMTRNLEVVVPVQLLGLAAMVLYLRLRGATWSEVGLNGVPEHLFRDVRWGCYGFLATIPWAFLIKQLAVYGTPPEQVETHPIIRMLQEGGTTWFWVLSGASVLACAPLWEEFVFRQILQGWGEACEVDLRTKRGAAWATGAVSVCASSVFFAFAHASWPDPLALLPIAVALGWLRLRTQGIVAGVTMHFLVNFLSFAALAQQALSRG